MNKKTFNNTPETIAKIQRCICEDCFQTIRDIAAKLGFGWKILPNSEWGIGNASCCSKICSTTADGWSKATSRWCTKLKSFVSNDIIFFFTIITGGESWICGYDPETKQQSSQWRHPMSLQPKKGRQVKSNVKSLLVLFFLMWKALCTRNLCHLGKIWIRCYTAMFWDSFGKISDGKGPPCGKRKTLQYTMVTYHHTFRSSPSHFWPKIWWLVPRLLCSLYLEPFNFGLFPKLKLQLKRRCFNTVEAIRLNFRLLDIFMKANFQKIFKEWEKPWDWCICVGEN